MAEKSLVQAFAGVARTLQAQRTAAQTLQRVVELARDTVPGCEHAGISWIAGGGVSTPATTGPVPVAVDRIQYQTDEGPCLSALRQAEGVEPVVAVDLRTEVRWPRFTARAVAETSVRSMLSFQLFVEEGVLGALNLYAGSADAFGRDSRLVGEVFAGHAAVALTGAVAQDDAVRVQHELESSRAEGVHLAERAALGAVLQASMLTDLTRLPRPDHLGLAALYRPAASDHEVGGDWYDAFGLPDGATAVVIGDVSGHDAAAAATMGAVRSMLRAVAWDRGGSPAQVLGRVDGAIAGLGLDAITSVLMARVEADEPGGAGAGRLVRWSSAGHLPMVLLGPDGSVRVLEVEGDLLLGVHAGVRRHDHVVAVLPGSTLLLYTDGLVERRGEHLRVGIDRLAGALRDLADLPLAELLPALVARQLPGGGRSGEDDAAALAVRLHAPRRARPTAGPPSVRPGRP